ncbi:MAG: serine/threonine-protein kinase [Pirellula sp.]
MKIKDSNAMDCNKPILRPGLVIGNKYELIEPLGGGGMGVVWKAKTAHADFAVKFINPDLLGQDDLKNRFERERSALSDCRNIPNVAAIIDFVVEPSLPNAIVMQYVHGRDLSCHINDRLAAQSPENTEPLFGCDAFLRLATSICSSLAEVHRRGIVHRDIKPNNIMISSVDMVPYLTDFGIAQFFRRHGNDRGLRERSGTQGYMAPEVELGLSSNPISDQWSLAATFYAAMIGHPPDKDHVETGRVSLSIARKLGFFADPIIKALRKNPSERYSKIDEFEEDLKRGTHDRSMRNDTTGMISGKILLIDGRHTDGHLVSLVAEKSNFLKGIVRLEVGDSQLDSVAIKNLLEHLPDVKVVEVKRCPNIEPSAWSEVLKRPCFEVLKISDCNSLSPEPFTGECGKKIKWMDRQNA